MPRIKGITVKKVKTNKNYDQKKEVIKSSIYNYFSKHPEYIEDLNQIINNKKNSPVNIKSIFWFLEEYCKETPVFIDNVLIYSKYKTSLKVYSKKFFQVHRRGEKFLFQINGYEINSSISQLNFFKWAFKNQVIPFLNKNISYIQKEE